MNAEYRMTLPLLQSESASADAKPLLDAAKAQLGFVPNMYAAMAHSPGLLATYFDGYDRFRKQSGFSPVEQEVIFLTISRENGCAYCVSAHSMVADVMSKVPAPVIEAIRNDQQILDAKLAELSRFTRVLVSSRGLPGNRDVQLFLDAGYSERHVLEIILAISVKTLSNYANHLFHTPLDQAFAKHAWTGQ